MNPKRIVIDQILAHLNGELTETELVAWAEDYFVALSETGDDIPDEQIMLDLLGYIGAGDAPGFPLSWEVLSGFLEQLGVRVRVIATV